MYRKDIDGLRAVAVLLVTLFHLDITSLAGGYVGVDVFFVISGYLITRNILKDGDRFRFSTFYWRRVHRLMPAVWATTAVTILIAAVIMRPEDLAETARSAIASTLSISNIHFWLQAGYWDTSSAMKPLLHTWSLAVEEQFYLFWPMLLVFLMRRGSRAMTAAFVALIVAGTVLSVWATSRVPSAAFYLMPFRVMEFALGALIAQNEARIRLPTSAQESIPVVGIALIVASALSFDKVTAFPGVSVLLPCIGAALLIASNGKSRFANVALENGPMIYLGRISYSLYLVHWPIVSLYRYATLTELTLSVQAALLAMMLVAAVLLHHLVEKPFRYGEKPRPALAFGVAAAFTVALPLAMVMRFDSVIAAPAQATRVDWQSALNITKEQFLADRQRYGCPITRHECTVPQPGRMNILIIGDSHGADGHTVMRTVFPTAHTIPGERAACNSFVGVDRWYIERKAPDNEDRRSCLWNVKRIYDDREMLRSVDVIAFSFLPYATIPPLLDETLSYLATMSKAKVVILTGAPNFTEELPQIVRARKLTPSDAVPTEFHAPTSDVESEVKAIAARHGALYLSKSDYFCPAGRCNPFVPDQSALISYDQHHLSVQAAEAFARSVTPQLRKFLSGV